MIYVAGILGFVGGFSLGLMLLLFLLRDVSKEDLAKDPYIRQKYGILNWIIAILGSYSAVALYERLFM